MNIRILLFILCLLSASQMIAQHVMPSVNELTFDVIADRFNTYNDKREPMSYLSAFTVEGESKMLEKTPIEVMFNPIAKLDRGDCLLMRWDPVLRVWMKFAGNHLHTTYEGALTYWSANIDAPGHYALMKEIDNLGTTVLTIQGGYATEEWRYVQHNLGVVCEGFSNTRILTIPLVDVSPLSEISLSMRKNGEPVNKVSNVLLGTVVKDFWKVSDAVNRTYEISFASLK